jgi:chitin synthase
MNSDLKLQHLLRPRYENLDDMSRPTPTANVSFQEVPPSRRAQEPARPSAKNFPSKSSIDTRKSYPGELGYDEGDYVDVNNSNPQGFSASNGAESGADVRRKKSMVKPDRERIDPGHRLWHYREHAADDGVRVQPSCESLPIELTSATGNQPIYPRTGGANLRRGKSLLARDADDSTHESGLNLFKRGATIRRKASQAAPRQAPNATQTNRINVPGSHEKIGCLGNFAPGPKDAWMVYCYLLTICVPGFVLRGVFDKKTPESQRAWREKIGIVSICVSLMTIVGFVTFGFTGVVCGEQPLRIRSGQANNGSLIINGYDYDLASWKHPAAGTSFNGTTNPIYMDEWLAGGKDASFMFQKVNQNCLNIITPAVGSGITNRNNSAGDQEMGWYFPCNLHDQNGTSPANLTGVASPTNCHVDGGTNNSRVQLDAIKPTAEIYYTWDAVKDPSRNLAVYKS